jgi:hypothetical protein
MTKTTGAPASTADKAPLDRQNWHGYLTLDNADAVVERLNRMLVGRHYTFVTQLGYVDGHGAHEPEVRTSNQLVGPGSVSTPSTPRLPAMKFAHFDDGDYSWSLSTSCASQADAHDVVSRYNARPGGERGRADYRELTHLWFYGDLRVQITYHAPSGARVVWVVAVEDPTDYWSDVPQDDEPVVGEPSDSIAVRVGRMRDARYEGVPAVQITHRLASSSQNVHVTRLTMLDPDQVEVHARELLVAARQMREERARSARR